MSFQRDSRDDDVDGIAPGPCRAARGTRHERAAAATVVPPPTRASRKAKGNPVKSSPYRRPFISPFRFRTLRECGWPTTRRRTNPPTSIPNKYTARPFGSRPPSPVPSYGLSPGSCLPPPPPGVIGVGARLSLLCIAAPEDGLRRP